MNWFKKFMTGRYGVDQLSNALLVISISILVINIFTKVSWLNTFVLIILFYSYYRMFSRNINKRYEENMRFLQWWNPIRGKFSKTKNRFSQRKTHKFFRCPNCGQDIRVPKGKGRIMIRCPKCNERFEGRT